MSALTDAALEGQADEDSRATIRRLLLQVEKEKAKKAELVEAVYRAAKDAAAGLHLEPVTKPAPDRRRVGVETAVAVMSDWQLGKRTPTYNSEVCAERITRYGDKVLQLTDIQRQDHPVKELHVWLLGDLVEGELIFGGQAFRIDASLYKQVTVDGPRILADFLRRMLASFDRVHVTAVIGNHGAIAGPFRKEMDPQSNSDRMLYRIVQMLLADEARLTWTIPDDVGERDWYAIDRIGNYSCLLFHGDQIRGGFAGFPFYGLGKKVWAWASGSIDEHFDDVALGHFHQLARIPLNRITARVNGSTESSNTYAQENLGAASDPSQWLLYVHPEGGHVTAEYAVRLI